MTVYMVVNVGKQASQRVACHAGEVLLNCGVELLLDESSSALVQWGLKAQVLPSDEAYKACDIVLCIGGDGTMLHAARFTMKYNKPLMGVNIGRLGFLTVVESDELHKLKRLTSGEYKIENRCVLRADVEGEGEPYLALNDVVLFKDKPERTVSLDIYCDNILVSRFRGDGIIFATATGSTAYSLSAGGPILDARLEGVVVTQICAHIVHTSPLVVSADRMLHAIPTGDCEEEPIGIICDGLKTRVLKPGENVKISRSECRVPLIQLADAEQLESIDKKLKGR